MISVTDIQRFLRGKIVLHQPLADFTAFRIGGPADYYVEPASKEDAVNVIRYFRNKNVPCILIRPGSNILVSDEGFRGAALNLQPGVSRIQVDGENVYAEAGVSLPMLLDYCIQRSLAGLEALAGVSGSFGGLLMRHGGAERSVVLDYLNRVEVFRNDAVITLDAGETVEGDVVLAGSMKLRTAEKEELLRSRREFLLRRNAVNPLNIPNACRIFKNPEGAQAATIIHQSGLVGKVRGKAMISRLNGNLIVNNGGATARDVLDLVRLSRKAVKKKFNTDLDLELSLIGFREDMLKGVRE
jgi:UDP-N-acetylmuramate dehydrogenase